MARGMNRRQLLAAAGSAAAWATLGIARRALAAPQATLRETKVISHQPDFYHGWPTVAAAAAASCWCLTPAGARRTSAPSAASS